MIELLQEHLCNEKLAQTVLQSLIKLGVKEFCLCPGARNSPFISILSQNPQIKKYFFFEERSAAFFGLGRSRKLNQPVAIVVTSGTAVAELLPAAMEAYYTGVPLVLVTADRPRRYRGCNAPQSAEQVGLFGHYATAEIDLAHGEDCLPIEWCVKGPLHVNVCFEEPQREPLEQVFPLIEHEKLKVESLPEDASGLQNFLGQCRYPFVIVGGLLPEDQAEVSLFLENLKAPVYLEAISGLREHPKLQKYRIERADHVLTLSRAHHYLIDGILRIGGVPTFRLWRDLEDLQGEIPVFSLNHVPFSGLSWATIQCSSIKNSLASFKPAAIDFPFSWKANDRAYVENVTKLYAIYPKAEPSLCHALSKKISSNSQVYLGNSMPIRQWDEYAQAQDRGYQVFASRGLNGIDGQISTFLGICSEKRENWGIFGDLTALYDLAGPWVMRDLKKMDIFLVVLNNGGGRIFSKMFPQEELQNLHDIRFKSFAELWNLNYHCLDSIDELPHQGHHLIELQPDWEQTQQFWNELKTL